MPNTLTFDVTKTNTTRDVEYLHPNTNSWQTNPILTGVLAGTYSDLKARLRGTGPSVIATYNQQVTVLDPAGGNSPTINSFTPTTAPIGSNITVTGTNLLNITSVVIGGVQATVPNSMGGTTTPGQQVTLLIPNGAASNMPITITTTNGSVTSTQNLVISAVLPSPANGSATPSGDSNLQVTADTVPNATGYQLFATDTGGSGYMQIGSTLSTPSYQETGLGYNHTRYYRWKALGNGTSYINSPLSAEFLGTTSAGDASQNAPTINSVPSNENKFGDSFIIAGTNFIGANSVTINNVPVKTYVVNSATQITAVISTAQTTGPVTVTTSAGSATSTTNIIIAAPTVNKGITRLDITVDFAAINKDTKTNCTLEFSNGYGSNYSSQYLYKGSSTIKYRGNSTSVLPKKPFSLGLIKSDGTDLKFPVLGMYNDSDFILLAEYQDPTYLRTYISHEISRAVGNIAVNTRPVEVYINGDYYGLYSLTEKIKASLVGIESLTTAAADQTTPNITGGYLVEKVQDSQEDLTMLTSFKTTYYGDNYSDIRTGPNAHSISVVAPKFGKITQAQTDYVKQSVLDIETTLTNGWLDLKIGPQTKLDKDTLLKYYLTAEFCQSVDAENHSSFLYKKRGAKFMHGPLWDMDISFLTYTYYKFLDDHANANFIWESNGWANKLFADRYFRNDLSKLYVNSGKAAIQQAITLLQPRAQLLIDSGAVDRNNNKWNVNTTQYVIPISTGQATNSYTDHVQFLKDWITTRLAHFDATYVPLNLIGTPVGGYKLELIDFVPNSPRAYDFPDLVNASEVSAFFVTNLPANNTNSYVLMAIGSNSQPSKANNIQGGGDIGVGLNTFTQYFDTIDDNTTLKDGKYKLLSFNIPNNNPANFVPKLNGVAVPHSIKPSGGAMTSIDFSSALSIGQVAPNRVDLYWPGMIKYAYIYYPKLSDQEEQDMLTFLRNNEPQVTQ